MGRMGMLSLAVVGTLAVGGPAAGSAAANTPKPKLKLEAAGEVLPTGAPILATSSNFFLNTPTGKLTCQETSLSGTLEANSEAKTDKVQLEEGIFAGDAANEGLCSSNFSPPLNKPEVTATIFPWTLTLTSKGVAEIKTQILLKVGPSEKPKGSHPALSCVYSTKLLHLGDFQTNGEPLTVTFTNQILHRYADSAAQCYRSKNELSGTFAFSSGGQPISAVIG